MIEPKDPEAPRSARFGAATDGDDEDVLDSATAFTVHLERVFQGPLDLLLQLVRDKELEIHVVSLVTVCDAFCKHVRSMAHVDVDEAADYLVIAATLLAIKSRSLLPQEEIDTEEELFDPGAELVQQLLAYKELRRAADELAARREMRARLLPAGGRWLGRVATPEPEEAESETWDLGDVSVWDLFRVIARLEQETGFLRAHHIRPIGRPLRAYVEELWLRLQEVTATSWSTLMVELRAHRGDAAYTLVALLELAKQQQIDVHQEQPFGDFEVRRVDGASALALDDLDRSFDRAELAGEAEVGELVGEEPL
ncbi:MAG: segregation/condensation protein A [Planctomycetota bacterium]|nr:segregation/condensation protein A [Planctomycetota bacterium]